MADPKLTIKRRNLPHWTLDNSVYFVTFRLLNGKLNADEQQFMLQHLRSGHDHYYRLVAVMVMPDHVHVLLQPMGDWSLSRIMKGIKGVSARRIQERRATRGRLWQDESFDRIIRDDDELQEKLAYMMNNPVKAGLCDDGWKYPGWYFQSES